MEISEQIKTMSAKEKEDFLRTNATHIEPSQTYTRPLTPEEITTAKEKHAELSLVSHDKSEAFKIIKDDHNITMKELKVEIKEKLFMFKNRQEQLVGELYHFADQYAKIVTILDKEGNTILERKLRPEERQGSVMDILRTGTNV